jgi:hypothetical protein
MIIRGVLPNVVMFHVKPAAPFTDNPCRGELFLTATHSTHTHSHILNNQPRRFVSIEFKDE